MTVFDVETYVETMAAPLIKASISEYQTLKQRLAAAGDPEKEAISLLDTADDSRIAKFRENRAAAQAKIEEIQTQIKAAQEKVMDIARSLLDTTDVDIDALRKQTSDAKRAAKALIGTSAYMPVSSGISQDDYMAALTAAGVDLDALGGSKGGAGGAAGGTKRPRIVSAVVAGHSVEGSGAGGRPTFGDVRAALAASGVKVSAPDLIIQAETAAGQPLTDLPEGEQVVFHVGEGENLIEVKVVTAPKPGPRS